MCKRTWLLVYCKNLYVECRVTGAKPVKQHCDEDLFFFPVGVKSGYSPVSTVYSQPPPPQRQVTALKPLAPASSVSTSYNIYPVSTSVQQPPTPISSYTPCSSFNSTAATSYSGKSERASSHTPRAPHLAPGSTLVKFKQAQLAYLSQHMCFYCVTPFCPVSTLHLSP